MNGHFVYLIGLSLVGVIGFCAGLIAIKYERRGHAARDTR
jgi:preprotein translocase subunit Sss1